MIKITQVRDGGNHVTQSTLTLDAWVERMKEEVKTCPVTMFRSQLRHVLPGDHCEAADKLPKMMPAAEFRKTEGGQCMKAYNGLVELTVGPLAGRAEVEQVKREAWKLPQTRCAFMGAQRTFGENPGGFHPTRQYAAPYPCGGGSVSCSCLHHGGEVLPAPVVIRYPSQGTFPGTIFTPFL